MEEEINLKQRKPSIKEDKQQEQEQEEIIKEKDEVIKIKSSLGKTPDGTVFKIPSTHNMLSSLFDPRLPKSYIDILTLSLLSLQFFLYFYLSKSTARTFFLTYFISWRLSYNLGLGYILIRQSKEKWLIRLFKRGNWMDKIKRPKVFSWIEGELKAKMGNSYDVMAVPLEFNVWILFRHFVDVILLNDFLSYFFFAISWIQFNPTSLGSSPSTMLIILRWLGGLTLILFNLWVKVDAHRIVKDYAWYWGDAFFLSLQDLVFDGVFEFAPHPMYSVGYAGYYGLSLIVASELVLFISIAAHACQFGFLVWFENPHIERTYGGGRKVPLAARIPLKSNKDFVTTEVGVEEVEGNATSTGARANRSTSTASMTSPPTVTTRHDLDNRYFKMDLLIFKNFDFFRFSDLSFLLIIIYSLILTLLPALSKTSQIILAFIHASIWRFFHSFVLGTLLKKQSQSKWIVRHFLKHYLYHGEIGGGGGSGEGGGEGAVEDAFGNWKKVYNLSLFMTYASFCALAWRCYSIPTDWTVGTQLVRHTLGTLLILLHLWTAQSTFEVLGPFGWFYGDFFIQDYPLELYYTGIFRFLNNPERSMGGAAFFGLVLICGSKLVLIQAVVAVLSHWWFLSFVENPHMKKLYGDTLRKDAGVTKTLKEVVVRNASVLGGVARNVREVQGTFEKVFDETAEVVEEFLSRSKPKLKGYVNDTKVLLKQSGERLVITRVSNDLAQFDQTRYSLTLQNSHPSSINATHYQLGEAITVNWSAPHNHSRKDWIGIYRLGANRSELVTRVSSQGHWLGVNRNEWDGDVYEGERGTSGVKEGDEEGKVTFSGKKLPWEVGTYELRYHHDGKHSVLAIGGPIEIYVKRSKKPDDPKEAHDTLTEIVAQVLGFDPAVIPASAHHLIPTPGPSTSASSSSLDTSSYGSVTSTSDELKDEKEKNRIKNSAQDDNNFNDDDDDDNDISTTTTNLKPPLVITTSTNNPLLSDPDDFIIYSKEDAEHIAYAIKQAFEIDLTSEVVVAAANVGKLVKRVLEARSLLKVG